MRSSGLVAVASLALVLHASNVRADDTPQVQPAESPTQAEATPAPKLEAAAMPAEQKNPAEKKKGEKKPEEKKPVDPSKAWETAPAKHRGGFAIGLLASGGIGASNGYPADSKKIGRAAYYTESGVGFMTASGLWVGGALADWLTFGVGFGYSLIFAGDTRSPAPFMFFHTDVYPLYALGGQLRNLGVMAHFGLGFPTTTNPDTEEVLIDGTGASFVQAGVFWEGIKAWKVRMGPYIATHYMWSDTIRRPSGLLGFRISLYTAP